MEELQINVAEIVAIWMAGSVVLVLALAFAARFAVKPVLDSVTRMREARVTELERRFTRLERRVERAYNTERARVGYSA